MAPTTITIPDPTDPSITLTYRIRSLASAPVAAAAPAPATDGAEAAEITRWANFCASCFAYKANPPPASYFERHYWNDPGRDARLVKVAEFNSDGDWEIVSSLRVFRRKVSNGSGGTMTAGGIGEVCTSEFHRRRSLSKMLLHDAIETMTRMGMDISLLHASPDLQRVYERGGDYEAVRSRWSVVSILGRELREERENADRYGVRVASFPADTPRLATLHRAYSESRFTGCIIRSDEYWTGYVSKELGDTLLVLTDAAGEEHRGGTIIAWLSVRERGGRYQLREFGADRAMIGTGLALELLLREAVEAERFNLHVPTSLLDEVGSAEAAGVSSVVDWTRATSDDDAGWMYRPIHDKDKEDGSKLSMVEMMEGGIHRKNHLIWPTDSF